MTKTASNGDTYIGLVTRGNLGPFANQNEDIQAQFLIPLVLGESYDLSIDLSFSENWGHFIDFGSTFLRYDTPAKLQIFGGTISCENLELLWESPIIEHLEWMSYPFIINPQISDVNYLILRASHSDNSTYFGNILIDNISIDFCPFAAPIETRPFDTLICENDSLVIDASTPGGVYQWNWF